MFELPSIVKGYTSAVLALVLVTIYFVLVLLITRRRDPQRVSVTHYQPPTGVSPAADTCISAKAQRNDSQWKITT